jgi:hypothetical protein
MNSTPDAFELRPDVASYDGTTLISALYFLVLERTWGFCACVISGVFGIAWLISVASCAAIGGYDDPHDSDTAPWRFAASHVFTVRLLPIRPRSRGARRSLRSFPVVTLHPRFPFNVRLTGKTFD